MKYSKLTYRVHAIQRMMKYKIKSEEVISTLKKGETIKNYPDDKPYPSQLLLGWYNENPIHVVVAYNKDEHEAIIITTYRPNPNIWESDYRSKK